MSISKSIVLQNPQTISSRNTYIFLLLISCTALLTLFPETCFAAGTGLDVVYDSLIDKIGAGSKGSKIAAALSFVGGLWQARQGNLGIAATSFGIATLLGIGVENII